MCMCACVRVCEYFRNKDSEYVFVCFNTNVCLVVYRCNNCCVYISLVKLRLKLYFVSSLS